MADWTPQSRAEEILFKTINGEPYDGLPQSRIEELLLELKEVIEQGGGGGGGTDNYNSLKNLPQINGTTLKGNKTSADLGLPSVAANPTGEAVGELTSIDINGSKYSIPESSEYEETTLWTGSENMLSSFTATIANPYTDYDALRFEYESGNTSHNFATHYEKLISKDTLATPEWFSLSDFYLANGAGVNTVGKFTDTTNLSVKLNSVNWFTSCTLTKIVGIKYGNGVSGGGGGGTVERVTLSDTTITSAGTYALSDNYAEFDQIEVWHASSSYASQECECTLIGADTLKSMMDENRTYTLSAFGERFINLTFSSSAINVLNVSNLVIVKIVGVRFGGGGSGSSDYNQLQNQPKINDVTLSGDKTSSDLGLLDEDDELTTAQMSALIALLD